jgi:hypothetical protein
MSKKQSTKYNFYTYLTKYIIYSLARSGQFETIQEQNQRQDDNHELTHQPVVMNQYFEVQLQKLVKDAYTQY